VLAGEPAAVSSSPGTLDVFVQGADGALWDSHFDPTGQQWIRLGGRLASAPFAVTSATGQSDAFVRGTDNAVWHASVVGATSLSWHWEPLGGQILDKPAAVSVETGAFDVFVEGTDHALWHAATAGANPWTWDGLGGRLHTGPWAATAGTSALTAAALVEGADHQLWQWNGGWQPLGGRLAFRPTAASIDGAVHAFVQGTDNALWHQWRGNWESLGGQLTAPPCGAPPNPWRYNLCGGNFIYAPPATFCRAFPCVPSFWSVTGGYIVECYDGKYSHAGGQAGACSNHFGEFRPLWV
jgi:hypothetical protein